MLQILVLITLLSVITPNTVSTGFEQNILLINGQGKPVHLSNVEGWQLIILQNAPDTIIENLIYTDGPTIFAINSDNLVVRNNIITNAGSYALFVEFSDNVQIYNNTIESGTHDGIISYSNNDVVIDNNRIGGVVKNGIYVRGNNVTISNNQVNDIAGSGIFIDGSSDLVVENNSINNVDWTPIAPDQGSFDSGTFSGNMYNGILLSDDDINPAIPNTTSNEVTSSNEVTTSNSISIESQSTDEFTGTSENETSSTKESFFPFQIFIFMMVLVSIFKKGKKQILW